MRLKKSQQGMTAIGWIVILFLVGLIAMAGIRLLPVYIQSHAISSIMQSVTSDTDSRETAQVRRSLIRLMNVNDVRAVDVDDFSIETIDGRRVLVVEYEHRVPFIANIDFLVSFEKEQAFRSQ